MTIIEFGVHSELSVPDDLAATGCGEPTEPPLADPLAATRAAFQSPLGYPPLSQAVVPGDRVVLALEENFVQPAPVIAGTIQELLAAGLDPESICVLRSKADAELTRSLPTRDLAPELREQIRVIVHDPSQRDQLALLNISSKDEPIYLNRELVDADLVIPLSVAKPAKMLGHWGIFGTLFPTFADEATQQRFCSPRSAAKASQRQERLSEAREAGWLLGICMVLQVIPGPGETLLQIVAGEAMEVERRARELYESAWRFQLEKRASMVVATLPGGRQQQSWTNLGRALDAALQIVEDNGTIAICCDLRAKPGPSLRKIARCPSLEDADRAIQQDSTPDAVTASQLVRALQRVQVYMLSGLAEDVVQSLGLAYVASPDEVVHLASRHRDQCIWLQNAQQAVPRVVAEMTS